MNVKYWVVRYEQKRVHFTDSVVRKLHVGESHDDDRDNNNIDDDDANSNPYIIVVHIVLDIYFAA